MFDPLNNFGVFVSFLLGSYLSYREQAKLQLVVPIIFIFIMIIFPESPVYLSSNNKEKVRHLNAIIIKIYSHILIQFTTLLWQKAIKSCRFYKGNIEAIEQKIEDDEMQPNAKLKLSDFCKFFFRNADILFCWPSLIK